MKITSFVTSHVNDVEEKWASRSTSPGSLNKGFTLKRHKRKSTYFHVDIWEDIVQISFKKLYPQTNWK